jgi:hypothetical protein
MRLDGGDTSAHNARYFAVETYWPAAILNTNKGTCRGSCPMTTFNISGVSVSVLKTRLLLYYYYYYVLLVWKLLVFEFLFGIPENCLCSMPVLLEVVLLLDSLQLQMQFTGTFTQSYFIVRTS